MRQDRNGVRTAQDLERKYDLANINRNSKQSAEGINRVDKKLEAFVNEVVNNFAAMEEKIDESISYDVLIESSNGNVFKNGDIETTLTAIVRKGNEDITDQFTDTQFSWTRVSKDPEGDVVWNEAHKHTKTVAITNKDVYAKAVFNVILTS